LDVKLERAPSVCRRAALAAVTCSVLLRLAIAAVFCVAGSTPSAAAPASPSRAPARVISDTASELVFRVQIDRWTLEPSPALEGTERLSIPGYVPDGDPGTPQQFVRKYFVGLPPQGTWRLSWRVVESIPLGRHRLEPIPFSGAQRDEELGVVPVERYEIDPAAYDSFRSPVTVSADGPAWIRHQRILPLRVRPLSYDPTTGEATLAKTIEIRVSFAGGGLEGAPAPGRRSAPVTETPEWEDVFSRMLVNSPQARSWRLPLRSPPDRTQSLREAPAQTGPAIKLAVKETGLHRVTAATLVSAGFPANRPVADLHLYKRGYDEDAFTGTVTEVAYKVIESPSGTPGVFEGEDALVFYGLRLRDEPMQADPDELYTDHNVYWLEAASGTPMADRALAPGYLTADTSSASFPLKRRFTDDGAFFEGTKKGETDYYFFNDGNGVAVDFPFEVESVEPSTSLELTVKLNGSTYEGFRSIETRLINSERNQVLTPYLTISNKDTVRYQADLPAAALVAGVNTFHYRRIDEIGRPVRVLLNWLEVSYEALFRARENALRFNTGTLAGDTSIAVTQLSDTDVFLFDVTDPNRPVNCVLTPSLFTNVGGTWALTFRDAISSRKEYALAGEGGMIEIPPEDVALDSPSSIIGGAAETGVDVLVVSHGDFLVDTQDPDNYDMHDWVRYRRAQGKRVLMVDVEDVYDEFNGGVTGTRGIDRFIRHFFELGNAGFVLLVGDGCEDHKRSYSTSNPDFVPSHCRTEYVASGFNQDEVVTLDKRYVKLPDPGGSVDPYPDLVIGRFPVGNMGELERVLYKVFAFEKPKASDFWRRRMIVVADDGWGEGAGSASCYTGDSFEAGQEECAQIMESAFPGTFDVVRFYLSDYNNKYHTIPYPEKGHCEAPNSMYLLRQQTRADATPAFLNELSQGATLVTIQGHMNRSLVTHEWLFVTLSTASNGGKDHLRCNNRNKPWIIFGMGCHFSDYAIEQEMARIPLNNPNGDCFAEQLLFVNNEGAASTYGSTGFEFLDQVKNYMKVFTEIWFYEAPYEDMVVQTGGRWVFGPMMFLVEAEAITRHGQQDPVDRYHILGDPLLRIDAGPPLITATVNGRAVQSGDNVSASADTIDVVATVTDENVIEKFELWVDGEDMSSTLDVEATGNEPISPARSYEVRFRHGIRFDKYDIVLKALQAPDTTSGQYYMAAEFVLHVPNDMDVTVNGRVLNSGDAVPTKGNYAITLRLPTFVPSSEIGVRIDEEDVVGLAFSHPTPEDSTAWVVQFSKTLSAGTHEMTVTAGNAELPAFTLVVEQRIGLRDVVNYPNPFADATQFLYTADVEIEDGTIDVFTVSGKRVVRLDIPPAARNPGQNAVFWDGRDGAGDEVANGVYLYVIRVSQRGQNSTIRGKLARMK
jgi:hypothetical protein